MYSQYSGYHTVVRRSKPALLLCFFRALLSSSTGQAPTFHKGTCSFRLFLLFPLHSLLPQRLYVWLREKRSTRQTVKTMDLPSFLPFLFSVCWPSSFFKAFLSKISPLCLVCSFFSSCLSPHFPFPPPALRHLQVPPSSFLSFSSSSLVVFLVASSFPLRSSFIPSSAASHSISPTPPGLHYDGHLHRALPSQADFPSESTSPHPSLDGNTHSFPSVSSTSSGSSPHVPSTSDLPPSAVLQILLPHQRSRAYSLHSPWWLGAGSRWWFACPSQVSDCCQFFSALNREGARETRHARKEKETGAGGVGCSPGFCSQRKGSEEEEDKKKDAESVEGEWPSKEGDEQDLKGRREVVKKGYEKEEQADEACTGARRQKLSGGLLLSWSSHLPHKTAEVLLEEERKRCFLLLEGEKGEDGKAQRETRDSPSSLFPTCDEGGGDRGQIFWDRMRYKELQRAAYLNEEFPPVVEVMLCVLLLFVSSSFFFPIIYVSMPLLFFSLLHHGLSFAVFFFPRFNMTLTSMWASSFSVLRVLSVFLLLWGFLLIYTVDSLSCLFTSAHFVHVLLKDEQAVRFTPVRV